MQFYKHSEISKMYIYIYKTNQGNIKQNCVIHSYL
jgi:hypothetical protein